MQDLYTKKIRFGSFTTSETELKDLLKAWLAISIAFGIVLNQGLFKSGFFGNLILSALTVGFGFLLHELGHKIVAQKYGCFAEFRAFNSMLLFMIIISFFGFVFAAPGAVMISGPVGRRRNGKISLAGPLVNIGLAIVFMLISIYFSGYIKSIANAGLWINSWLALFNLIPIFNLDGAKILRWNKVVYAVMVIIAFILTFSPELVKVFLQ